MVTTEFEDVEEPEVERRTIDLDSTKFIDLACQLHVLSCHPLPSSHRSPRLRMESQDVVTQVGDSIITALREAAKDCGNRGLQFASN